MTTLSQFSPAETLILLQGKKAKLKDLLKVTLMDLLLKQALQTLEIENSGDKSGTTNTYVIAGSNFKRYNYLPHEEVFLRPYLQTPGNQILFSNLVKIGYENTEYARYFVRLVFQNEKTRACFAQGLPKIFKGKFSLTSFGKRTVEDIKSEIRELDSKLSDLMHSNPDKALEILKTIRGNVFLVKGIDFKLMKQIEDQVIAEVNGARSSSNSGFGDPIMWLALDTNARNFESSCSTISYQDWDSGAGDSSDTGDAGGDSGCSGCGGSD
jgi:hypothetical protein